MTDPKDTMKQLNELQQEASTSLVSRRLFLTAGAGALASLAIPGKALAQGEKAGSNKSKPIIKADQPTIADCQNCITIPQPVPYQTPAFVQPQPASNPTTFDLTSESLRVQAQAPEYTFSVRLYNRQLPGPTFIVNPGDKIELLLNNQLPPNTHETCEDLQPNTPRCFDTTNMHFHGLHVSPESICDANGTAILSSDDALNEVEPGTFRQYCVWLPEKHAPGTHWYHSHLHGASAVQVSNGMAGAILVKEKPENNMGINDANDKLWLIQEVLNIQNDAGFYNAFGSARPDKKGQPGLFLVNGQYQPTLTIDNPNTLQRWRFINGTGTPRGLMTLKLCKCDSSCEAIPSDASCTSDNLFDMYLIAVDGISFYGKAPQRVGKDGIGVYNGGWKFAPGNRADFLVKLPAGKYKVIKDLYPGVGASVAQVLAYINVKEGTDADGTIPNTIPGTLPDYLQPILDAEIVKNQAGSLDTPRKIEFDVPDTTRKNFVINGNKYDSSKIDHCLKLNTAERWVLSNNPKTGRSPHPFHIHVNPFQLEHDLIVPKEQGGSDDPSNWRFWDTFAVDAGNTNPIRHRFWDYYGEFVLHCHLLIHEDQGMMQNIYIEDDCERPGVGPCCSLPLSGASQCIVPAGAKGVCPPTGECQIPVTTSVSVTGA